MKKSKYLYCLPSMPLFFVVTIYIKLAVSIIALGLLVYLVVQGFRKKRNKRITKDGMFWFALIIFIASLVFVFSDSVGAKINSSAYFSYLLSYVFTFSFLLVGLLILRSSKLVEINNKLFYVIGILLILFAVLYMIKNHQINNEADGGTRERILGPATTGLPDSFSDGCGEVLIF